ncbi:DUF6262 family protein [Nocardia sp. NBC_00881]|uniref:DUF6262 family protein n=1 Tax=Nocardia sp. NBC_00881 TaxID=2975995 RepID=UPI00386A5813|nr:DUF6262 family protein [Nocardia sp. NBC_00881]
MTGPRTPAQVLRDTRERTSREKRAKVLAVIDEMTTRNEPITFTGVARAASVSNWLVYAPGVREHIERARQRQQAQPHLDRETGRTANTAGLKTDLAIARAEVARLRTERDQLKATIQRQLGQQLDQYAATDLITRVDELTAQNKTLIEELAAGRRANADLENQLTEAQDDLTAARASLRRMIREESHQ